MSERFRSILEELTPSSEAARRDVDEMKTIVRQAIERPTDAAGCYWEVWGELGSGTPERRRQPDGWLLKLVNLLDKLEARIEKLEAGTGL